MSGTCKDCAAWGGHEREDGRRHCALTLVFGEAGRESPEFSDSLAHAHATYHPAGYDAYLLTSPDFGCNQFEAKG